MDQLEIFIRAKSLKKQWKCRKDRGICQPCWRSSENNTLNPMDQKALSGGFVAGLKFNLGLFMAIALQQKMEFRG